MVKLLASGKYKERIRRRIIFRVSWDELELIHHQRQRIRGACSGIVLLVPTAGVQTACCIGLDDITTLWRWQAVIRASGDC